MCPQASEQLLWGVSWKEQVHTCRRDEASIYNLNWSPASPKHGYWSVWPCVFSFEIAKPHSRMFAFPSLSSQVLKSLPGDLCAFDGIHRCKDPRTKFDWPWFHEFNMPPTKSLSLLPVGLLRSAQGPLWRPSPFHKRQSQLSLSLKYIWGTCGSKQGKIHSIL